MFDLHMHTVFSDGKNTAEEMVQEAISRGLETVGISDHSSGDPCACRLFGCRQKRGGEKKQFFPRRSALAKRVVS